MTFVVELRVYRGKSNPKWLLSADQLDVNKLNGILRSLPHTKENKPSLPLGYHGAVVSARTDSFDWTNLNVFKEWVTVSRREVVNHLKDVNKEVEKLILGTAPLGEVRDTVEELIIGRFQ